VFFFAIQKFFLFNQSFRWFSFSSFKAYINVQQRPLLVKKYVVAIYGLHVGSAGPYPPPPFAFLGFVLTILYGFNSLLYVRAGHWFRCRCHYLSILHRFIILICGHTVTKVYIDINVSTVSMLLISISISIQRF